MEDLRTVGAFKDLMVKVRDARRRLVVANQSSQPPIGKDVQFLKKSLLDLENHSTDDRRSFSFGSDVQLNLKIRDELRGLRKDTAFFDLYSDGQSELPTGVEIVKMLADLHDMDDLKFSGEVDELAKVLQRVLDGPAALMVTDWDGTMKHYCSQYVTCVQPAYSAMLLCRFAARFLGAAAVLTSGPLYGPGILDLTAIPVETHTPSVVVFGGSWGREWLLDGERTVADDDLPPGSQVTLDELAARVGELRLSDGGRLSYFDLIGSGLQRKVDRLCVGVQNVSQDVDEETRATYTKALKDLARDMDPTETLLQLREDALELELIVRANGPRVWDKAAGFDCLLQRLADAGRSPPVGAWLVCGDTHSDVPMALQAQKRNPGAAFVVFVGADDGLKKRLREELPDPGRLVFVSCPDVIHAAMACVCDGGPKDKA